MLCSVILISNELLEFDLNDGFAVATPAQEAAEASQWMKLLLPILLGAMGATLSAMMNFAGKKEIPDVFTSFWVTLVRPLIGAVSGLVAVLVFSTDFLNVDFPAFMFAAFAFGFSERLVLGAIDKLDFRKGSP